MAAVGQKLKGAQNLYHLLDCAILKRLINKISCFYKNNRVPLSNQ